MGRFGFRRILGFTHFFLNFIPNIGAILATAFPALLALIQFQSWLPFIVITSGLVAIQFIVGNLVEPRF